MPRINFAPITLITCRRIQNWTEFIHHDSFYNVMTLISCVWTNSIRIETCCSFCWANRKRAIKMRFTALYEFKGVYLIII